MKNAPCITKQYYSFSTLPDSLSTFMLDINLSLQNSSFERCESTLLRDAYFERECEDWRFLLVTSLL
jgi:hypothetical protein